MGPVEPASELLRTVRKRAGLSQAALAERTGVTQSVVSAYESGARQPSLPTLGRLVEATGLALEVRVSSGPGARRHAGPIARSVHEHRKGVLDILGRYRLARRAPVFSAASLAGRKSPAAISTSWSISRPASDC